MMKIMYLMHIDWNWIKQRPQFLAEELSKKNRIMCIAPHWYNRNKLQMRDRNIDGMVIKEFYGIPKAKMFKIIKKSNDFQRSIMTYILYFLFRPQVVFITFPELYRNWMEKISTKIIYDCMDDHIALKHDPDMRKDVFIYEKKLVRRADCILVSSEKLRRNLVDRYGICDNRIQTVRNGYDGKTIATTEMNHIKSEDEKHIAYIGTVSSWFDIDSILNVIKKNRKIIFHIIGPFMHDYSLEENRNIVVEGIVEHDRLYSKIKEYDALIMPFILNDIVSAVDPVKLYEYINFNKPIISIFYDEIERFEPFVWFYGNKYGPLESAVEKMIEQGRKYTDDMRISFLRESRWENRAEQVQQYIREIVSL